MGIVLVSVQVGRPLLRDPETPNAYRTAFVKTPVEGPVHLRWDNLEGDRQADRRVHGGPDQAVLSYAFQHYLNWRRELGGRDVGPGGFGENFTVDGLDEDSACIGDVFEMGEAILQVSHPRAPCWKIERRWDLPGLTGRVEETGRTGWYQRVLREGWVEAGDQLTLADRPHPAWTVRRTTAVLRSPRSDPEAGAELADLPSLTARHRARLLQVLKG
jgi:MOSC domain-containing protein YiiM